MHSLGKTLPVGRVACKRNVDILIFVSPLHGTIYVERYEPSRSGDTTGSPN